MEKGSWMYSWNPVFNFVMEVKDYYELFNKEPIEYRQYEDGTFFEHWVNNVPATVKNRFLNITKYLKFSSMNEFLLIRYKSYAEINDIDLNDFWYIHDGFYNECRSIVIDVKNEAIVLCPFRKFRNINECEENSIDNIRKEIAEAENVEVTNKLDGSMQSATWYNDSLFVAGSQAVDPDKSWRLQDGIRMLKENSNYMTAIKQHPNWTFIFEYISLKDAHVVKYKPEDEGMYLVGIRNNHTGGQLSYHKVINVAYKYEMKSTWAYDKTFDEVLEDLKIIKSDEQEGFVLNIDGHMVKAKCDDYVKLHGIISAIASPNIIIKSIADGTYDDLISKVPEAYVSRVKDIGRVIAEYLVHMVGLTTQYYYIAPKYDKKIFMLWVDRNVPDYLKHYVRNKYLGIDNDYLKSGSEKNPKYIKMNQIERILNNDSNELVEEP